MNDIPTKPNCYECKHRGTVPGDAHSCCRHPEVGKTDPIGGLATAFMGGFREAEQKLDITGDLHGKRRGWFLWPVNFDPVWLLSCNGFEAKP